MFNRAKIIIMQIEVKNNLFFSNSNIVIVNFITIATNSKFNNQYLELNILKSSSSSFFSVV